MSGPRGGQARGIGDVITIGENSQFPREREQTYALARGDEDEGEDLFLMAHQAPPALDQVELGLADGNEEMLEARMCG